MQWIEVTAKRWILSRIQSEPSNGFERVWTWFIRIATRSMMPRLYAASLGTMALEEFKAERWPAASRLLTLALIYAPDSPGILRLLGCCYERLEQWDEANKVSRELASLDSVLSRRSEWDRLPHEESLGVNLAARREALLLSARIHSSRGMFAEALVSFESARAIQEDGEVLNDLVSCLHLSGSPGEAERIAVLATQRYPSDLACWVALLGAYRREGRQRDFEIAFGNARAALGDIRVVQLGRIFDLQA